MEQELAQPRIHAVPPAGTPGAEAASSPKVVPFDFRKPGQTPGSQMRAIYMLKQKFLHRAGEQPVGLPAIECYRADAGG